MAFETVPCADGAPIPVTVDSGHEEASTVNTRAAAEPGRPRRAAPYTLVKDPISHDTVEALELMLAQARRGHITGIAFAVMLKRGHYSVSVAGEAFSNPTLARGIVCVLDDELRDLARDGAGPAP